jgi:hypothetical protein
LKRKKIKKKETPFLVGVFENTTKNMRRCALCGCQPGEKKKEDKEKKKMAAAPSTIWFSLNDRVRCGPYAVCMSAKENIFCSPQCIDDYARGNASPPPSPPLTTTLITIPTMKTRSPSVVYVDGAPLVLLARRR